MADPSQPLNRFHTEPDDHLSRLYAQDVEAPWYKTFIENLKDTFNRPKLPPLEVTSQPVPVKDIWGLYGRQKKSWMVSTGFQAAVAILPVTVSSSNAAQGHVQDVLC